MVRVWSIVDATPEEREAVDAILGKDVAWASDGHDGRGAKAVLAFFPRRELAATGQAWTDLDARILQLATAGANHVPWEDLPAGMQVTTAPGSSAPMVAEHVLAMLLWWTRRFAEHDAQIRAGRFRNGAPVRALSEIKVGLVGYGGIGQAVAESLSGFAVRVRAVSRSGQAGSAEAHVEQLATMENLEALADWSDALVLCLPLVRDTVGLIDGPLLARLGDDALLINVARGAVVDQDALYAWLAGDKRRHAALDVWWKYPKQGRPFDRPFHKLPNVLMTPHDAPNVTGFRKWMLEQAARQLRVFLDTGEVQGLQDRNAHLLPVEGDGR